MYARIDTTRELDLYSDAELVRLLKSGQDEALEELLRRHRDALYRFCCHLMTTREDAEDICQETLARAITRVDSLQTGSAFRSWLFSIARNLSVDSYRTRKRTCPMPDDEAIPLPLYTETPQDRIEIHEEHQTVAEALGKLADSHQRVLLLREVNGLSYAAIAEEMKVTQSAVETLLFRARRRLREEYSKSAVPMLALLNDLRDLAMRFAAPVASGSAVTKLVVTSALVGGGLATTAHVSTPTRQSLGVATQHHVVAERRAGTVQSPHVVALFQPPVVHLAAPVRSASIQLRPAQPLVRAEVSHPRRRAVSHTPPAPPAIPAAHSSSGFIFSASGPPAPPAPPSKAPYMAVSAGPSSAPPPPPPLPSIPTAKSPVTTASGSSTSKAVAPPPPPPPPSSAAQPGAVPPPPVPAAPPTPQPTPMVKPQAPAPTPVAPSAPPTTVTYGRPSTSSTSTAPATPASTQR